MRDSGLSDRAIVIYVVVVINSSNHWLQISLTINHTMAFYLLFFLWLQTLYWPSVIQILKFLLSRQSSYVPRHLPFIGGHEILCCRYSFILESSTQDGPHVCVCSEIKREYIIHLTHTVKSTRFIQILRVYIITVQKVHNDSCIQHAVNYS